MQTVKNEICTTPIIVIVVIPWSKFAAALVYVILNTLTMVLNLTEIPTLME